MTTSVQIIRRKNGFVLVHWENADGLPQRAWVTPDMVLNESGTSALVESPERGVPFGVPWNRLVDLHASPIVLEQELKRRNIWTFEDLQARPQDVIGALQSVYGLDYATLVNAAKEAQ